MSVPTGFDSRDAVAANPSVTTASFTEQPRQLRFFGQGPRAVTLQGPTTMARPINGDTQRPGSQAITSISGFRRSSVAVATSREGHRSPRAGLEGQ